MIRIAQPQLGEGEDAAVRAVLRSGLLTQGKLVEQFEIEFAKMCGTKYAVAVSSGTSALLAALAAHGIGPGDEVVTTPFSFVATGSTIRFLGARPVFADIRADDFNINPDAIASKIGAKTKAIMPVHLYGQPCNMDAIVALARDHDLAIIEDACQAHGAEIDGRRVGSFGTGCFSFYATKNMTTSEGGMITTDDPSIDEACRLFRNHGQRSRYVSEVIGLNLRMTEIQAALGLVQLTKLEQWTEQRRKNARWLTEHLVEVRPPAEIAGRRHVFHQYTVTMAEGRDRLRDHLARFGIDAMLYYPVPIHRQPAFRQAERGESLPVAERLADEVLSIPVHPGLSSLDLEAIAGAVAGFFAGGGGQKGALNA